MMILNFKRNISWLLFTILNTMISRGIYANGGEVKRSSSKGSNKMVMYGWRRDMGKKNKDIDEFGRYSHEVREKAKKGKVRRQNIEVLGDHLTCDLLAPHLERLFGSFMKDLSVMLAEIEPSIFWETIGGCRLTTLGITSNYFANPHLDLEDLGFAFLTWFVKDWQGVGYNRSGGELILPEYGLLVIPTNGLIFAFFTCNVLHCTRVAFGYDVIGMSCSAKKNVVKKASSRIQDIIQYFGSREDHTLMENYWILGGFDAPQIFHTHYML